MEKSTSSSPLLRLVSTAAGDSEEHDLGTYGTCLRGARTGALEMMGRWEESASLSIELLAHGGASPVNRINPLTSLGKVRARQGASGCWECLDEAAAVAEGSGEPQYLVLVRLARAEAYWLEGETAEAMREAELANDVCARMDAIAAKLFISAKTVDHHVSAALAKLDAPTRDVAVAHAARLGPAGAAEK